MGHEFQVTCHSHLRAFDRQLRTTQQGHDPRDVRSRNQAESPREARRKDHARCDRLPVQPAAKAECGLDGVAEGVAVVQKGTLAGFPFIQPNDLGLVDKVQIQQVLLNLIRNAIESMQDASRRELVISSILMEENMLLISVSDTGTGIAPEIASQLFQPFVTTKRHGMGVGLSISRTIIEGHGGQIWVESNPDGGTVFRFTVGAVTREDTEDAV